MRCESRQLDVGDFGWVALLESEEEEISGVEERANRKKKEYMIDCIVERKKVDDLEVISRLLHPTSRDLSFSL